MNEKIIQQSDALSPISIIRTAFVVGIVGLIASLIGLILSNDHHNQFFRSYLVAFTYWVSIPLEVCSF